MNVFELSTSLITDIDLAGASDDELSATVWAIREEQQRRAIEASDPEALSEHAFSWGFDKSGRARPPRLHQGLLVCPGSKFEKSATSHDCTYVSIDSGWVWEHADILSDVQRSVSNAKTVKQSVTIIPAWDGLEFDVVSSVARGGPCRMKSVASYKVVGDQLVPTTTRSAKPHQHR